MYQIDNEHFGKFLSEMRREKNMTQKVLGEKLFVSDKTVSKWERGASLPNVILLIPLADTLGITVTELLKGERLDTQKPLDAAEVENLVLHSLDLSVQTSVRQRKKNWIFAYLLSILLVLAEIVLFRVSNIPFRDMTDSLYVSGMMLIFAGWFCLFAKDLLPAYYDKNKINFVSQGIFRIHMTGLSFNNGNWTYVLTVFRIFTLGTAVLYPLLCYAAIMIGTVTLWNDVKHLFLIFILTVLLISTYVVGKKYA